jgi:hypothetical protein
MTIFLDLDKSNKVSATSETCTNTFISNENSILMILATRVELRDHPIMGSLRFQIQSKSAI